MLNVIGSNMYPSIVVTSLGSARVNSDQTGVCGSELKSALTETFLKKMLTSAAYLASKQDYSFWYTRLVHFYTREGGC